MIKHRFAAMLAAALVAVFTGTALAGNGNGGSNGNSGNAPGHQQSTPAQSSQPAAQAPQASQPAAAQPQKTPPGQAKKAAPAPAQAPPASRPAAAPAQKSPPGQAKKAAKQSSTSASQPAAANAQGVKPSNRTQHDTHAPASSNKTKLYGNGKTAGQIATQAGFGNAMLHGPGNSQPHKTAPCPGGHEVDVHALKHKAGKCAAAQAAAQPAVQVEAKPEVKEEVKQEAPCAPTTQTVTENVLTGVKHMIGPKGSGRFVIIHPSSHSAHFTGKHPGDVPMFETVTRTVTVQSGANCAQAPVAQTQVATQSQVAGSTASQAAAVQGAQHTTVTKAAAHKRTVAKPAAAGGVKGAVVVLSPTKAKAKPAGGVLGATHRLGSTVASSKLPFTGLPLWIFALAALALIALGYAVRRTAANRI